MNLEAFGLSKVNSPNNIEIRVVSNNEELYMVFAVRSAVFLAEQSCPYREEFDGNDFSATHVMALVDDEPAASMRIRYFGEFAKLERIAVRKEFRGLNLVQHLCDFMIIFLERKGFKAVWGQMQERHAALWTERVAVSRGSFERIPQVENVNFSGLDFTPIKLDLEPGPSSFTIAEAAHVLNRPEGDWDRPGILETGSGSVKRPK